MKNICTNQMSGLPAEKSNDRFVFALSALVGMLAVACSSAPVSTKHAEADLLHEYQVEKQKLENTSIISPGFRLRIKHESDSDVSGSYKVDIKGFVMLPYKTKAMVAGLDLNDAAVAVENALSPYFKARNKVSIEILGREYAIEVRGLVQKPGQYTIKLDTNIEEVMAMSGTMLGSASSTAESKPSMPKPEYVRIVIPEFMSGTGKPTVRWVRLTDYFLKYDVRNEVLWKGGEQLFFQITADPEIMKRSTQTIQILGEVHHPGEYPLQPGGDLYSYIAQAGGPTATADSGSITVVHKQKDESQSFDLAKSSGVLDLEGGDVILIKSTQVRPGFFERMGPFFLSLGSLAVSIVVAVVAL